MHLKPGHIIEVGGKEGVVIVNKDIKGHECIVVVFDIKSDKKDSEFYEVFDRNGDITVKKLVDEEIVTDFVAMIVEEALEENYQQIKPEE